MNKEDSLKNCAQITIEGSFSSKKLEEKRFGGRKIPRRWNQFSKNGIVIGREIV